MAHYRIALASLLVLLLAVPVAAQRNRDRDRDRDWDQDNGPRETETIDRTLTLDSGGTVRLKTFSGRVTIAGTNGNQVVIRAVRRASRERLNDIKLEITQRGSTIEIDANHRTVERRNNNVVETDFDIQVPSSVSLNLNTFSAPVTVTNVNGTLRVEGFSSDVRLTDVSGPTRVKTFGGDIEVQARTWREGDEVNLETFSGDVTMRLPDNARGEIDFDSFSGRFNSDLPVNLSTSSRRSFRGSLNGGGSTTFRVKTFSGSAAIRR